LAVVAALFTLIGDLLSLILAIISAQSIPDGNKGCSVKKQIDLLEKQIAEKISPLRK